MSPPVGYDQGRQPAGMKPHLVVKLKSGWSYDPKHRRFVEVRGKSLSPGKSLPDGARIVYMVPDLVTRSPESLTKDERDLARYLQILLPEGVDPSHYIDTVRQWECAEEVRLPPEISLP